jgi:hypothetical protein
MTTQFKIIEDQLDKLNQYEFKPSGIFTNSLLKTTDTTQIIRDIRDEEITFFQNKKIQDIDYEIINNFGFNNNDQYAQYETLKLLEDEISNDIELNKLVDNLLSLDLFETYEYTSDIQKLIKIFKHCYTIKKLWASPNNNMLDIETSQILSDVDEKLNQLIEIFKEISDYHKTFKNQRMKLTNSLNDDNYDNNIDN